MSTKNILHTFTKMLAISSDLNIFAPPGAFPREADRGLCNFLHVTLTKNPNFSDFDRLDGGRTLDPRCLYSVSGLFRGYIERFCSFHSRHNRNFALAREFLWGTHTGISDPAKIPIQAEIGIWNLAEDLVDTPRYSVWSLRTLRLYQPTADRPWWVLAVGMWYFHAIAMKICLKRHKMLKWEARFCTHTATVRHPGAPSALQGWI